MSPPPVHPAGGAEGRTGARAGASGARFGARAHAAPARLLAVPLALEEAAGVARQAWPAAASVPLPRGRLRDPNVWIAAPGGRATLAQACVLERWPDGSVRWLLVDFLADVAAGDHATYTLHDGPAFAGPFARAALGIDAAGRAFTSLGADHHQLVPADAEPSNSTASAPGATATAGCARSATTRR